MRRILGMFFFAFLVIFLYQACGDEKKKECQVHSDCPDTHYCYSGSCSNQCLSTNDCLGGLECIKGTCQYKKTEHKSEKAIEKENAVDGGETSFVEKPLREELVHEGKQEGKAEVPADEAKTCSEGDTRSCFTGKPEHRDVGECKAGKETCVKGVWGPCLGQSLPSKESCDKKDNDCDGKVDGDVCKQACKFDDDCKNTEECKAGFCERKPHCVGKTGVCKTGETCDTCKDICVVLPATDPCKADFNCTSNGGQDKNYCDTCVDRCRPRKGHGLACEKTVECFDKHTCKDNATLGYKICTQDSGGKKCNKSTDCSDGYYCSKQLGQCVWGCQQDNDCGLSSNPSCRSKCEQSLCVEDCSCRSPQLDCADDVRFCPKKKTETTCRKPVGPICKPCQASADCGCKPGDDCFAFCTRKSCTTNGDCSSMSGGATTCYEGHCSTKKACTKNSDCPEHEKCSNNFCATNCNNLCIKQKTGNRCMIACDPRGHGKECPSKMSCIELLPSSASGKSCKGGGKRCNKDGDCSGSQKHCGPDGFCSECSGGRVCRNIDKSKPLDWICIDMPSTICTGFSNDLCSKSGF